MSGSLSPDQLADFWREGFVSRVPVLTADEAREVYDAFEAIEASEVERGGGTWAKRDYRPWEQDDHPLRSWLDALARHPRILDAVESILGPDLLLRNADVFLKEPGNPRGIGWHLDTAMRGPEVDQIVTVWLGLTPSTRENGGLLYAAGSHRLEIPGGPKDRFSLTLTKDAAATLDPARTHVNVMEAGMCSIHHFGLVHASGPNRTSARRLGFVGRYMATSIDPAVAESGSATLVRGTDRHRRFALKERFPMTFTR